MQRIHWQLLLALVLPLALMGCVDDKYDLSNIDSTVKIQVNDLVIPINIDAVSLSNIFDIKEGDRIEVVDGCYAIIETGNVNSSDIKINPIHVDAPKVDPTSTPVQLPQPTMRRAPGDIVVPIATTPSSYNFKTTDVSSEIHGLDYCTGDLTMTVNFSIPEFAGKINGFTLNNLKLQLPKGLVLQPINGASYNLATGLLTYDQIKANSHQFDLVIRATGMDFSVLGDVFNYEKHSIDIKGDLYIAGAEMVIAPSDIKPGVTLPAQMTVVNAYRFSDFEVTSFSGLMSYAITGVEIPSVDINDLPNVLSQEGTDISLVNPVIYLQLHNPLQSFGLYGQSNFVIKATHADNSVDSYSLDAPYFKIGGDNPTGVYNYYMSPLTVASLDPAYSGATHVQFSSLGRILSGNGIPNRLDIELVNPELPMQRVKDFALGHNYGYVGGNYKFIAPIQLADGSKLLYTDRVDGWKSDDLDDLTITTLEIALNITNNLPVAVNFSGFPVDSDGKRIAGVNIECTEVPANCVDQPVVIRITGEIKDLDGMEFTAKSTAVVGPTLTPGMTIDLKNIRPKVSGYFIKEL